MMFRGGKLAMTVTVLVLITSLLVPSPVSSTPVATSQEQYLAFGRIFPDPHGCKEEGGSPFAKGNVCATDMLQFSEMIAGIEFLEETFPDFVKVYRLDEDFACNGEPVATAEDGCKQFMSAGLSTAVSGGFERERFPFYMARITDEAVPEKGKKHFVFSLSIHGLERQGAEGGTRAAEDLATWAACETERAPTYVDCQHPDNDAPHPLLEATPERSITAGEALRRSSIYFIWPNPDGWVRGDRAHGAAAYSRGNGNGVDLNRDWPEQGYTFRPYTPWSEPEAKSYGRVLQAIGPKDEKGDPKWEGGIDLHGMANAPSFSYTLLGGTQRPYDKDQRVLQTVKGAWRDAEKRLSWSNVIKPNDAPEDDPRMYGVQWGTIWDTINYTVTGSFGNWIDSRMGLNGDGIDNEMALSPGGIDDVGQLHVDGNKSLIYSMINYALKPEDTTFETKGRVAYLHNSGFVSEPHQPTRTESRHTRLPPQEDIEDVLLSTMNSFTYEFDVKGPPKVYNGGIEVTLDCASAQGVGTCSLGQAYLERRGGEHPGGSGDEQWETVNAYYASGNVGNSGQALHANQPAPGRYRIRLEGADAGLVYSADINFTKERGWENPGQLGYRVSNMRFWRMLQRFADPGISRITSGEVARGRSWKRFDTIVVTNKVYPELAKKLRSWVSRNDGNLVLTDKALKMLPRMGILKGGQGSVSRAMVYAGHVNFITKRRAETYDDRLARKINQPGSAEGPDNRRQTYEPVPLGISIRSGRPTTQSNSPVWVISQSAWAKARGRQRAVATTFGTDNVSLGEIKWRGGRIRVIGGLLPMPTKRYYNPFGLSNYALTYTGYQLLQNLLTYKR